MAEARNEQEQAQAGEEVLQGTQEAAAVLLLGMTLRELRPGAPWGASRGVGGDLHREYQGEPLSAVEVKRLEQRLKTLGKQRLPLVSRPLASEEAAKLLLEEPHLQQLLAAGESPRLLQVLSRKGEVLHQEVSFLPEAPAEAFSGVVGLLQVSAAYWQGDAAQASLQRVSAQWLPSEEALRERQAWLQEVAKRDHRRLGAELDLFSFPEAVGAGLPVFHPAGGIILREMEDYVREEHLKQGFRYVKTPHLAKEDLFYKSGHLPHYAEGMFPALEEEHQRYRLKAMNCPLHNEIFRSRGRSYRELPLRLFEFGTVYRHESSGALSGLTRVRSISQDDSHSYVRPEQAAAEVRHLLRFMLKLLRDFGLEDFSVELSTRAEAGGKAGKFIGSDEQWQEAEALLAACAQEEGLAVLLDEGGAAFYGPKLSVQAKDALGRNWQLGTVQYDFNQPQRFGLEYRDAEGKLVQPVMIHSAKFGSFERFLGVLLEHYAGDLPAWLSPVQAAVVPVAEECLSYAEEVAGLLEEAGLRVSLDASSDRFPKKVAVARKGRAPFVVVLGREEEAARALSLRFRDGRQRNGVPLEEAVAYLRTWVASRTCEEPSA